MMHFIYYSGRDEHEYVPGLSNRSRLHQSPALKMKFNLI